MIALNRNFDLNGILKEKLNKSQKKFEKERYFEYQKTLNAGVESKNIMKDLQISVSLTIRRHLS